MENLSVYKNHVAFWGSELSNWYPCKFNADGHIWGNSEQYFMYLKAVAFNDYDIAEEIKKDSNPKTCKKLGRKVKGFDDKKWSELREDAMLKAVYAKFSQNNKLKNLLLSKEFEGKGFIEGSPFDSIWGVKMSWEDPLIDDEENWEGLNLLGKTLDKVRNILKSEK